LYIFVQTQNKIARTITIILCGQKLHFETVSSCSLPKMFLPCPLTQFPYIDFEIKIFFFSCRLSTFNIQSKTLFEKVVFVEEWYQEILTEGERSVPLTS
jgi:hypothetical protein